MYREETRGGCTGWLVKRLVLVCIDFFFQTYFSCAKHCIGQPAFRPSYQPNKCRVKSNYSKCQGNEGNLIVVDVEPHPVISQAWMMLDWILIQLGGKGIAPFCGWGDRCSVRRQHSQCVVQVGWNSGPQSQSPSALSEPPPSAKCSCPRTSEHLCSCLKVQIFWPHPPLLWGEEDLFTGILSFFQIEKCIKIQEKWCP